MNILVALPLLWDYLLEDKIGWKGDWQIRDGIQNPYRKTRNTER